MKNILFLFLTIFVVTSCEDVIDFELEEGEDQLVVDAWLNNKSETQVIKLRRTLPYFDNSFTPEVTGATITVADVNPIDSTINAVYVFEDENNDGNYTWTPGAGESLAQEGHDYGLLIDLDGDQYISLSKANRTATIDSVGYEYRDDQIGQPNGIYAQIYAWDEVGSGDAYWIKTFKNGNFLNKPQELNLSFDGSFSPGADSDTTLLFIPPIREAVNRTPDLEDDAIDDADVPPYAIGDTIRVEIYSLTQEAFFYLFQAREQMTQGDNGLFATPTTNVPTNIFSQTEDAKENPIGFFNVSIVASVERIIE